MTSNTFTTSNIASYNGAFSDVTTLIDGSYLVCWRSATGFQWQRYATDGSSIAGPVTVSSTLGMANIHVQTLADGGFLIATRASDMGIDGVEDRGYWYWIFDKSNNLITGPTLDEPNQSGAGAWSYGNDGLLAVNGYVVAVSQYNNGAWNVGIDVIRPNGSEVLRVDVPTNDTGRQTYPKNVALADGERVLIVWTDNSGAIDTEGYGIYGRIFSTKSLSFITPEFLINQNVSGDEVGWTGGAFEQDTYALTALQDGGFAIFWHDATNGYVQGRFFNGPASNYSVRTDEFVLNTTNSGDEHFVDSTLMPNGDVMLVYASTIAGTTKIFGKEYSPQGLVVREEFQIATTSEPNPRPRVAAVSDQKIVITWQSETGDGSSASSHVNIETVSFDVAITITSPTSVSTVENAPITSAVYTATATDPDANTTITYSISGGADAALFNINATTGVVTFKESPDFETPKDAGANNVYEIEVQASNGSSIATKALAIAVTNQNEAPIFASSTTTPLKDAVTTSNLVAVASAANWWGSGINPQSAAWLSNGNYVVAFTEGKGEFQIFGSNGEKISQKISYSNAVEAHLLSICTTPDDQIAVAWNDDTGIWVKWYNSTGEVIGSPNFIASAPPHFVTTSPTSAGIMISYTNYAGVYCAVGGATTGFSPPKLVASAPGTEWQPFVISLAPGMNVVGWGSYVNTEQYAQIVDDQANPVRELIDLGQVGNAIVLHKLDATHFAAVPRFGGTLSSFALYDVSNRSLARIAVPPGSDEVYDFLIDPKNNDIFIVFKKIGENNVYMKKMSIDGEYSATEIIVEGVHQSADSYQFSANGNTDGKIIIAWLDSERIIQSATLNFSDLYAPSIVSVTENVPSTNSIYAVTATDPDANTTLTYSIGGADYSILGGADGALFNINASTGAVTFKRSPNFEAPTDSGSNNIYDIIVRASDGSLTATKAVAITVTDVPEATTSSLHGMTYFWKADATGKHALLSGVTVNASGGAGPSEGANAPIQVKNIAWDAAGHVIADVYAHITAGMDSFDLNLDFGTGTNAAFTSAMDSSWTLLNNSSASSLLISAYSLTAASSGDVKLGSLAYDVGSASQAHIGVNGGSEISFNNVATKATAFAYDMAHSTTGSDGSFSFSSVASGGYALAATRGIADIGNAITSADALSALKIAVSMNPNAVVNGQQLPVSPFQFMAADANGDGRVTSADALAILKMAVKLPTAITPEWMFVEDSRDFYDDANGVFTLNRSNAAWDHNINATVAGDTTENLVGILKGDVNGSWSPPAGSAHVEDLSPTYFTTLANTIHTPLSGFGIFG